MTLHRNAKSTPSPRLLLVRRVLFEGWTQVDPGPLGREGRTAPAPLLQDHA